jgi:hypothetical protein
MTASQLHAAFLSVLKFVLTATLHVQVKAISKRKDLSLCQSNYFYQGFLLKLSLH